MRWKPDVCSDPGCVLLFREVDNQTINSPAHLDVVENKCSVHTNVPNDKLVETILEENRRREQTKELVYQNGGKHLLTPQEKSDLALMFAAQGQRDVNIPDEVWKPGLNVSFSFDSDRNLIVNITGLTVAEKTVLRNKRQDLLSKFPDLKVNKIQIL